MPRRYVPDVPLPPYSYVPGRFPHPVREPLGHSYGHPPPVVAPDELARWEACRSYLLGVDLFNHGYYWEAHEAWEAVWHAAGRHGPLADFVKGLIKLAAALVKGREGREVGVRRHARRARELIESVAAAGSNPGSLLGLDLATLIERAGHIAESPRAYLDNREAPVVRLTDWRLEPCERAAPPDA